MSAGLLPSGLSQVFGRVSFFSFLVTDHFSAEYVKGSSQIFGVVYAHLCPTFSPSDPCPEPRLSTVLSLDSPACTSAQKFSQGSRGSHQSTLSLGALEIVLLSKTTLSSMACAIKSLSISSAPLPFTITLRLTC